MVWVYANSIKALKIWLEYVYTTIIYCIPKTKAWQQENRSFYSASDYSSNCSVVQGYNFFICIIVYICYYIISI
jgi:hypothetical protein